MVSQTQELDFSITPNSLTNFEGITGVAAHAGSNGDGLRSEFLAGISDVASNVKSFLVLGDQSAGDHQLGPVKFFDSKLKVDPIRAAAEEVILGGWSQQDLNKLAQEREKHNKEFKWWAAGAGIGIEPPKAGETMQRLERETQQVIAHAQQIVEKDFDMAGLQKERDQYDQALKRRSMQIGIGIPWPEPGGLMKEYERQVIRRINQLQK
ncbi:MAG: hypothetical protein U0105_03225 [Candidatus Obscuribacterales bacterium]